MEVSRSGHLRNPAHDKWRRLDVIAAAGAGSLGGRRARRSREGDLMKGAEKPKKVQKKAPQKTLKERRAEKRAAAKKSSSI